MINIRSYRNEDLGEIVGLFCRSVRGIASRDYDAEQIAAWSPEQPDMEEWALRLSSGIVLVAEVAERIAGFARLGEEGIVDLLFVDPEHQRQSVATSLMSSVLKMAHLRGIARLSADVSITARPFFESHGFSVVRDQLVSRRSVKLQNHHMEREVP